MDLNLDVAALEKKAVEQPDPVRLAVAPKPRSRKAVRAVPPPEDELVEPKGAQRLRQRSRVGKVAVQTWVSEDVRRRLKVLAAQTDVSIEEYLAGAVEELLVRHGA